MRKDEIPSIIKHNDVEKRDYQIDIFKKIKVNNSLVVLPTGLGKTLIGVYLLGEKLEKGIKTIFMAPTKPLCEQHRDLVSNVTNIEEDKLKLITGELFTPDERKEIWDQNYEVYFATPQVVNNDLKYVNLSVIGLMIFDEAHRASGDYAYVEIAKACKERAQFLGLTASPATSFDDLVEVCANLYIEKIEVRKEDSDDVKPFVSDKMIRWIKIEKSEEIKMIEGKLDDVLENFLTDLKKYSKRLRMKDFDNIGKSVLIDLQENLQTRIKKKNSPGYLYHALSLAAATIKLMHLKELILTQGIDSAHSYFLKLKEEDSRASKYIRKKDKFDEVGEKLLDLKTMPIDINKKLDRLKNILRDELGEGKAMIFAQYRDTVDHLVKELKGFEEVNPARLVGQSENADREGMSQDEQKRVIEKFENEDINVLVSTSIGEEGLDIPSNELVIFYEPVPSAIRYIQRKGRTGRNNMPGKVYVLLTVDSKDEIYQWKSYNEERKMFDHVYQLKERLEKSQEPKKKIQSLRKKIVSEQKKLMNF